MSGVLVCAATRDELAAFGLEGAQVVEEGRLWRLPGVSGLAGPAEHHAAVTGVGIPHTLLRLAPLLDRLRPARVVNTGIAGAYPHCVPHRDSHADKDGGAPELAIGNVVLGLSETFADLGMEIPDEERFRSLGAFPFAEAALREPLPLLAPAWAEALPDLRRGHGATVNACTGTLATGALRRRLFGADFESMEGAAVALACRERNVPLIEVRAISNMAARRDLRPENIRRALDALSAFWKAQRDRALAT